MKRDYLSSSALKAFAKSPNHYLEYVKGKAPSSPAMELGSAIHCMVLEANQFFKRYTRQLVVDRRTKKGKEQYAAFLKETDGLTVLTEEQMDIVHACAKAINEHPAAKELLAACTHFEKKIQAELSGVPFVGYADALAKDFIIDVKTCSDASHESFQRQAYNLMYHEQAAAYQDMLQVFRFYWICVETKPPYNVSVYVQGQDAYRKAHKHLHELIIRWKNWNGEKFPYFANVTELNLPRWA